MRRIYQVAGSAKTSRGEFNRYLGKKLNGDGRAVDAKFYLGDDQNEANLNRLRLEKLWSRVLEGTAEGVQPVWDAIAFEIGKAVARGALVYRLARTLVPLPDEESYVHFVARYAELCEGVVQVVPDDDAAYSTGLGVIERERAEAIRQRIDPGWPSPSEFPAPVIPVGRPGETLHKALDAYIEQLEKEAAGNYSGWLGTQIRQAMTLKDHHEDGPLGLLGEAAIKDMAKYWESRPLPKGRKKPVPEGQGEEPVPEREGRKKKKLSVVYARKLWECLVRVLRWVHKSDDYAWRLSPGVLDEIKFRPKTTPEEDAAATTSMGVEVWTPTQLALLYKHATPLMRCMMLLGLNCGFYPVDVGHALSESFVLGETHPHADYLLIGEPADIQEEWKRPADWLKMLRNKTKVYGEFLLWPHTAAAVRWAADRKRSLGLPAGKGTMLLPTNRGTSYMKATRSGKKPSRIANLWTNTLKRARAEDEGLPTYPFSSLRDTGADLIRRKDDTAANLYLRHGKPYRGDSLLELYANRPFLRLHQHLRRVEQVLAPVWRAVTDPFQGPLE